MSHTHTATEISIRDTFGGTSLHKGSHDRIRSGIPTRRYNSDRIVFFRCCIERFAQIAYLCVNVETIHGSYTLFESLDSEMFHFASRRTKNSDVHIFQLVERRHYRISRQFHGNLRNTTTDYTRYFKIRSDLQSI